MAEPVDGSILYDYDANDNLTYEGHAVRKGADTASAVWSIKKYVWAVGTGGDFICQEEAWADGNEFYDNIWDNRATTVVYVVAT